MNCCIKCGKKLEVEYEYCPQCGASASSDVGREINVKQKLLKTWPKMGARALKRLLLLAGIIVIIGFLISYFFVGSGRKRASFDIEYSESGIVEFLDVVCNNIDAESVEITDTDYHATNRKCTVELEVTLKDRNSETVYVSFYNENRSDKVYACSISGSDYNTEQVFECQKVVFAALEKTVSGDSEVSNYISCYEEVRSEALSLDRLEPQIVASYILGDVKVFLQYEHSFANDWSYTLIMTTKDNVNVEGYP